MIIVNGCSNAEGFELEYEIGISIEDFLNDPIKHNEALEYRKTRTWGDVFANKLGQDNINLATTGASNDLIILGTIDFIEKENISPDLVVIAPTSIYRKEYCFNNADHIVVNPSHRSGYLENMFGKTPHKAELDIWYEMTGMYFTNKNFEINRYYHLIRYFVLYMETRKIKYLIAPGNFGIPSVEHITNKSMDIDFTTFYYSNQYLRGPGNHALSEAHQQWGLVVHDFFNEVYG